jgi:hypothetical protein
LPRNINITEAADNSKDWQENLFQGNPTNIHQRWRWDLTSCNAENLSKGLRQKYLFEEEEFDEIMDSVCKMSVEIGMRMIALLLKGNEISYSELEEMNGADYQIAEVVAHIEPDTYRVLGIGLTYDYETMWKNRASDKSIPGASNIMQGLIHLAGFAHPDVTFTSELKALSVDLVLLLGNSRDVAENWIQEDSKEMKYFFSDNVIRVILSSLYDAFTKLHEESSKPATPNETS